MAIRKKTTKAAVSKPSKPGKTEPQAEKRRLPSRPYNPPKEKDLKMEQSLVVENLRLQQKRLVRLMLELMQSRPSFQDFPEVNPGEIDIAEIGHFADAVQNRLRQLHEHCQTVLEKASEIVGLETAIATVKRPITNSVRDELVDPLLEQVFAKDLMENARNPVKTGYELPPALRLAKQAAKTAKPKSGGKGAKGAKPKGKTRK